MQVVRCDGLTSNFMVARVRPSVDETGPITAMQATLAARRAVMP
jgi:hypothetical protein